MRDLIRHPEDSFIAMAREAVERGFPYIGMDEDGCVWGYSSEPIPYTTGGFWYVDNGLEDCLGSIDPGHLYWRRSSVRVHDLETVARVEAARRGYGWVAKDVDVGVFAYRVQPRWQPLSKIYLSPAIVETSRDLEELSGLDSAGPGGWKYSTYDFIHPARKDEEFYDYFEEMGEIEVLSLPHAIEIAKLNPLAQYVAVDSNGDIWAYSDEPIVRGEEWDIEDIQNHFAYQLGVINAEQLEWRKVYVIR